MSFWMNLRRRERILVASGGVFIVLLLLYTALIAPLRNNLRRMEESVRLGKVELKWMQEAAGKVKQLSGARAGNPAVSPLKSIDRAAGKYRITESIKRVDPGEEGKIKVWFENLDFVDFIKFLREIGVENRIVISSLAVERLEKSGLVNARVTFKIGSK